MIDPDASFVSTQHPFMAGVVCGLTVVAALLFARFFRRTRDPLFLFFSLSFFLQASGRLLILWMTPEPGPGGQLGAEELAPYYLLRLVAYGLIIFAIIHKNRSRRRGLKLPPTLEGQSDAS